MIRSTMVMLLLAGAVPAAAQEAPRPSLEALSQQARAAREARDYPGYLKAVEAIRDMLPWSPVIRYNMVRAYALNGRKGEALAALGGLADAGWGFDAAGDAVLAPLHEDPAFKAVAARLMANGQPRGQVAPWRKLGLAGKQPEGVAVTADGKIYVGALRDGIHRVEPGGLKRLYAPDAGWGIVGLRVDARRDELIACASNEAAGKGRVVRLALPDLKPRASVDIPAPGAFCNDSAVLPDGRIAVTDSTGGRLWIAGRTAIAEVKTDKPLVYPNGVAFGGGRLFVAHAGGLLVVDPATGATQEVKAGATSLVGIDGLTWQGGKLLAVQNGTQPIRVLRITPPAKMSDDAAIEVLASGHPSLSGATTAAAMGDRLLVLTQTGIPNGSLPDDPLLVAVPLGR